MFDKIIQFFKKSDELRKQRFTEFIEFYKESVQEFPVSLKRELNKAEHHVLPVLGKEFQTYKMDFTLADVLWWSERFEIENFLMLPLDKIKGLVMKECLGVIDSMSMADFDKETQDFYNKICQDILVSGDDETKA